MTEDSKKPLGNVVQIGEEPIPPSDSEGADRIFCRRISGVQTAIVEIPDRHGTLC